MNALDEDKAWANFLKELGEIPEEFKSLGEVSTQAEQFFDSIIASVEEEIERSLTQPLPVGYTIDKFEVIERIGIGGMADVYLAKRVDGLFEQRVAIKRLSPLLMESDHIASFEKERKLLAKLEHSSIARIQDGGITEETIPYLVMEYVEGKDLLSYSEEKRLNMSQKLELIIKLCRALEHAHGQLILHRDLKPSNVLVTKQGELKLLDFGIGGLVKDVNI
ncbi:MAG: serine/threonine-protein kinase [Bacteroidota bacterium]